MEITTPVFDAATPVAMQLAGPNGVKTVRVRFPNDEEWAERQRRRKAIVKNLGRGRSETTVPNAEEVDSALVAKIRVEDDSPVDVDPFEAVQIIERLGECDVDDVVQAGDSFKVVLRVLGSTVTHLLKMPSAKDVFNYRRSFARVVELPYNRQEITINLHAAAELYKKLVVATEGYAREAPIIHQGVAVKAAIDALDSAFQEDRDSNF